MSKRLQHYIDKGLISQSDFNFLAELDPSRTKKYLSFIIKSYLTGTNLDMLRNRVTEYDTLLNRDLVDRRDINSFKTFRRLDEYVEQLNSTKSNKELRREIKNEADIILDTEDIFIVRPRSYEASCVYGAGTKWCTTAKNSVHWDRYYYEKLITFYYIQIRSDAIKKKLLEELWKVAIVVYPTGAIEIFDAKDHRINRNPENVIATLDTLCGFLGISKSLFQPQAMDERTEGVLEYTQQEDCTELDLSRMGLTKIPDTIGNMTQLIKLILSENKLETLPESIGQLHNLKTLYLFHNQLTSLPEPLGNLKGLQWLGLTGNNIRSKTIRELKSKLPATRIYIK